MKYISFFILMFPFYVSAGAIGDSAILAELKLIYTTAIKDLQEIKEQSEVLTETKELAVYAYETYDEIRNFDLELIKNIIESDIRSLTELDDMGGLSTEQKFLLLTRELDRRIADPNTSPSERAIAKADKDRIESILKQEDLISELHKNSTKNLEKSAGDLSERDSSRIAAENLSILARIESTREKKRLEDERTKIIDNASARKILDQQKSLSEKTGW